MQGWHCWHPLCARAGAGGVWATHLCCYHVCRTIRLLNILQVAQEVLVWQSGRQCTILPSLIGRILMALQKRSFRGLTMPLLQELAL